MSPKQLALSTLRDLARRCLKEQAHLAVVESAEKDILAEKASTRARIAQIRQRIDRELSASGKLLGIEKLITEVQDEDGEDED